jgi:hypothetical protein
MRRILLILAVIGGALSLVGSALAAPKILSHNGSLVIAGTDAKQAKKKPGSEDTLYELLGQDVHVVIFKHKPRFWPRIYYGRSVSAPWRGYARPRNSRIAALIHKYARLYGVDPSLVRAVMRHESGFNPTAVSPKGAQGLMQLMPGTAALMGVKNPFDPEQNIAGGVGYLRYCLDRFQHNVPLAVAAYNAGPESVARCGSIPPFEETRHFVTNVMGTYAGPKARVPAASAKGVKPGTKASKKGLRQPGKSSNTHRRHRPKIIEVRSFKTKARDVSSK